jgi:hypothetical protein
MVVGRIAAVALLALVPPSIAEARSNRIEVRGSAQSFGEVLAIGDFKPRRDPTLGAAIATFGDPASRRSVGGGTGCNVAWPTLGVRIAFASFGTGSGCDPESGRAQGARVLRLEAWHTTRGLHVGDGVRRLRKRYPGARRHGSSYWLVTGVSLFGPSPTRYPVLAAAVRGGEVRSFKLEIGAAGD